MSIDKIIFHVCIKCSKINDFLIIRIPHLYLLKLLQEAFAKEKKTLFPEISSVCLLKPPGKPHFQPVIDRPVFFLINVY